MNGKQPGNGIKKKRKEHTKRKKERKRRRKKDSRRNTVRMNGPSVKVKKKEGQTRAPISADLPPRSTAPTFSSPFPKILDFLLHPPYHWKPPPQFYLSPRKFSSSIFEIDRILYWFSVSCSEIKPFSVYCFCCITIAPPHAPETQR